MNKTITTTPESKIQKQTRIIEKIVVVGYSGNSVKPVNRKVLVIMITVALVILAMLPVRTMTNTYYGWYYQRPLIVWIIENIQENYFIWDPIQ